MKFLFILFTFLTFSSNVFAQGFEWNIEYENQLRSSTSEVDISKTRSLLPNKSSLERYIPFILDQGETAMCVAYSLANCRTIIYSKNKKFYQEKDIIDNSFSPFYIYYNLKENSDNSCTKGLSLVNTILYAHNFGMAKLKDVEYPDYWPFTQKQLQCNYYPPSHSNDVIDASKYKIDKPKSIPKNISRLEKINTLKDEIYNGKPIIFGMHPMPSSLMKSFGKDYWKPEYNIKSDGSIGHAMTIIAYDDDKYGGSFLILNSYGDKWGNNGKIWIKYENLIDYSDVFVIIGRNNEELIFESTNSEKNPELSNSRLSSPNYINTDLTPPLENYIINRGFF